MERLTHEADFGLEDWEETLFFVPSDSGGAYNILDIAKYQGEPEFDEILKNISLRLAAYEGTGLEPEEIRSQKELFDYLVFDSTPSEDIERFKRLRELAEADRDGRCVVLPRLEPGQDDPGLPGVPGPPGNVVFCKDCGHLEYSDCYGECGRGYLGIVKPYDYCSRGMRRDKENNT